MIVAGLGGEGVCVCGMVEISVCVWQGGMCVNVGVFVSYNEFRLIYTSA